MEDIFEQSAQNIRKILEESEKNKVFCKVLKKFAHSFKVEYDNKTYYININHTSIFIDSDGMIKADKRYFNEF